MGIQNFGQHVFCGQDEALEFAYITTNWEVYLTDSVEHILYPSIENEMKERKEVLVGSFKNQPSGFDYRNAILVRDNVAVEYLEWV